LVTWKPDVVLTPGAADTSALHEVDASIPIVAAAEGDFVVSGLADNLARPGGNVTGLQTFSIDLAAKRLEILKELMPRVQRVAVLQETPRTETARLALTTRLDALDTAAKRLSVRIGRFEVASEHDVDRVFTDIKRNSGAVMVVASQFTVAHRPRITQLAIRHRLPSMHDYSVFVEAGGLASYGPKFSDLYRRAAQFVDRILKGAKPADLPIEQPTKFELVINLKTAKALGLTIPQSILLRADQVIE
jgi:putative ABC transport system substrate-binding protein